MKALVVESDRMSQCVLAKLLAERGHEVVCFENAEQAVVSCQQETYPLVFVGGDLPGMSGLQFCKWLRSHPSAERMFIMVAVSPGQPAELGQILSAGASDFLIKPYDLGTLKMRLLVAERHMSMFFRAQELEAQTQRRDQEMETVQAEVRRAGEAVLKEAEAHRKTEEDLETTRAELLELRKSFDARLAEQAKEISSKANELQNVTTFRLKVEEDLKRLRAELENRSGKHTSELESARRDVIEERNRSREAVADLERTRDELQARVRELAGAARQADEHRQAAQAEGQRTAQAFARAQAEWDERQHELQLQLQSARQRAEEAAGARTAKEFELLENERGRLLKLLAETQSSLTQATEKHALREASLEEALAKAREAQLSLGQELTKAREETACKAKDYAEAAARSADEVRKMVEEYRLTRDPAAQAAAEPDGTAREKLIVDLREELDRETARRRDLEEQLQKARLQMQERLRKMVATLDEG